MGGKRDARAGIPWEGGRRLLQVRLSVHPNPLTERGRCSLMRPHIRRYLFVVIVRKRAVGEGGSGPSSPLHFHSINGPRRVGIGHFRDFIASETAAVDAEVVCYQSRIRSPS